MKFLSIHAAVRAKRSGYDVIILSIGPYPMDYNLLFNQAKRYGLDKPPEPLWRLARALNEDTVKPLWLATVLRGVNRARPNKYGA